MASTPKIVPTNQIPHDEIDPDALKVIGRLRRFGHEAYLVGGCVRDLLLDAHPKDFDVITSARPRQVRRIFSNSRVIGRRFRLVHVIFGENIIEVSTFRADPGQFAEKEDEPEGAPEPAEAESSDDDTVLESPDETAPVPTVPPATAEGEDAPRVAALTPLEQAQQISDEKLAPQDLGAPEPEPAPEPAERRARDVDEDDRDERDDPRASGKRPRPDWDGNNIFGTPEEDARRRDFTINALFYDPERREIIDYVDGLKDIERGLVNPINDPLVSFAEDPVRMIRAVRFAAKLGFQIDARALAAVDQKKHLITDCSQRRLLEEIFKILKGGHAAATLRKLEETGLLDVFLPEVGEWTVLDKTRPLAVAPVNGEPKIGEPKNGHEKPEAEGLPATVSQTLAALHSAEALTSTDPTASGRHVSRPVPDSGAFPKLGEAAPAPAGTPESTPPAVAPDKVVTGAGPTVTPLAVAAPEPTAAAAESPAAPAAETPSAPAVPAPVPTPATGTPALVALSPPPAPSPAGEAELRLGPIPSWEPPARAIDAYLRVTWEHPPKEGPNDWVEDPHEEVVDAIFEAAAFARDVVLERFGYRTLVGEPSERQRARAVMKVLQLNNRLKDAIAWVEEQERGLAEQRATRDRDRSGRRGRRGRWRDRGPRAPEAERAEHRVHEPAERPARATGNGGAVPTGPGPSQKNRRPPTTRHELLVRYLEGLDKLIGQDVPLSTGVQLATLYAPMLREVLDRALDEHKGGPNAETLIDDIMRPIALRHSLARRDRDRVKRIVLAMRRLLREATPPPGARRRRSRGAHKILGKDYFQEALVLLWLHARSTDEGWDTFHHWQERALEERRRNPAAPERERRDSEDDVEDLEDAFARDDEDADEDRDDGRQDERDDDRDGRDDRDDRASQDRGDPGGSGGRRSRRGGRGRRHR